jgi:DNA-binding NtrC family response regulator
MPKQILVADDDPVLLNLYTRMLAGTGCAVSLAASFAEAAALINSHNYDLLVTDLVFPDGVGTDLITIFERKQGCARCILVTGSVAELDPDKLPVLAGYFAKPLDAGAFMAAVARALA